MSMTSMKAAATIKAKGYHTQVAGQFNEWRAELQKYKARAQKSKGEKQVKYARQVQDMEDRLGELEKSQRDLNTATGDKVDEIKKRLGRARDELKAVFDEARNSFKEW